MTANPTNAETPLSTKQSAFVEKAGVVLEATGLTRLSGRLLGWLLICSPREQSAEDIVSALQASTGGISTQARALIRYGFIERVGLPRDRRTYYRLKDHAFEAAFTDQTQSLSAMRDLASQGLEVVNDGQGSQELLNRLDQMHDLFVFLESEWPKLMTRFYEQQASAKR